MGVFVCKVNRGSTPSSPSFNWFFSVIIRGFKSNSCSKKFEQNPSSKCVHVFKNLFWTCSKKSRNIWIFSPTVEPVLNVHELFMNMFKKLTEIEQNLEKCIWTTFELNLNKIWTTRFEQNLNMIWTVHEAVLEWLGVFKTFVNKIGHTNFKSDQKKKIM